MFFYFFDIVKLVKLFDITKYNTLKISILCIVFGDCKVEIAKSPDLYRKYTMAMRKYAHYQSLA